LTGNLRSITQGFAFARHNPLSHVTSLALMGVEVLFNCAATV